MLTRKIIASAAAASQLLALAPAHAQAVAGATEYQSDANGNVNKVIDPKGRVTSVTVDNLNRPNQITLPPAAAGGTAGQVIIDRDGLNRVTDVKDPKGNVTQYVYSALDDTLHSSPDTAITAYWKDAAGNTEATQASSGTLYASSVFYDVLNRPYNIAHISGTTSLTYDEFSTTAGSENYGKGRLTSIKDNVYNTSVYGANTTASRLRLRYDQLGRVIARCQLWDANAASATYTCAASDTLAYRWGPTSGANAGRLLGLTYPSGRKVDYQYNSLGQITGITTTAPAATTATPVISSATYVPLDVAASGYALSGFNFGNGTTAPVQSYSRSYDSYGRITNFTIGKGVSGVSAQQASYSPKYDDASRITSIDNYTASGTLQQALYGYDDLDRLTSVTLPGAVSYSYTYDINGNRLTKVQGSTTTTYTYPSTSNKLSTVQVGSAAAQSLATSLGNITTDVSAPVGTISYTYVDHPAVQHGRAAQSQAQGASTCTGTTMVAKESEKLPAATRPAAARPSTRSPTLAHWIRPITTTWTVTSLQSSMPAPRRSSESTSGWEISPWRWWRAPRPPYKWAPPIQPSCTTSMPTI